MEKFVVVGKIAHFLKSLQRRGYSLSLWPLPVGSACCTLEYTAAHGPTHGLSEMGIKFDSTPPGQADLMIVAGTVTEKQVPLIKDLYRQMPEPKWVLAVGACAAGGGPYFSYNVVQGIDREIPVDVYVPGCPPTPEAVIEGIKQIKDRVRRGISAAERRSL